MCKISKAKIIGLMLLSSFITILGIYLIATPSRAEAFTALVNRLKGKILLRVEHKGEAWYVNPDNGQRYFLGRPQDAFNLMRGLGLGISDEDLFDIPSASGSYDELTFNSSYGFSYNYPSTYFHLANYSPFNDVNKYQTFSNYNVGAPLEMGENGIWVSISMNDNAENLTLQEYAENLSAHPLCTKSTSETFFVNGNQALKVIVDCMNNTEAETAYTVWHFIMKNNKIYSIYGMAGNPDIFNNLQMEYYTFINGFEIN